MGIDTILKYKNDFPRYCPHCRFYDWEEADQSYCPRCHMHRGKLPESIKEEDEKKDEN